MLATCVRLRASGAAATTAALPALLPPTATAGPAAAAPRGQQQRQQQQQRGLHNIYALKNKRNASSALPDSPQPARTALYDFHVERQGKMVPFAGYVLPVQYGSVGIADSHLHTRRQGCASLFDVSHMLQTEVRGRDRHLLMESLTTADVRGLAPDSGTLTVFTEEGTGGILDDLIVCSTTAEEGLFVVSNAGRRQHDQRLMERAAERLRADGKDVSLRFLEPGERSLLALQGPGAVAALQPLAEGLDLGKLYFMRTALCRVAGQPCRVTRCGYTGEDGVEISVASTGVRAVAEALLGSQAASVQLAGLGARDSLRLEAGLCLYGNDIDVSTTPVEAGLTWLVAKRRREAADFPGAEVILRQIKEGPPRRRVGLLPVERGPPARGHTAVYAKGEHEDAIGEVTSGCPSPSLGHNIAIGYVRAPHHKVGTEVQLLVRNKFLRAKVAKMPFVPSHYYMAPK